MSFFHRTHVCKFLTIFTRLETTAIGGELWFACEGTSVSTNGRHSSHFSQYGRTKVSNTCVQVFLHENAWISVRPTTDRDLESQRHEEVILEFVHDRQPTAIL